MGRKKKGEKYLKPYRVEPGKKCHLKRYDTRDDCGLDDREEAARILAAEHDRLRELQRILYAQAKHSLLVVLQAMDTGGKDSTIRKVVGPINPQGVVVTSFKAPTAQELAHGFLWRIHRAVPHRGMIGIFNRSHYEDVLIARVRELAPTRVIKQRYEQINAFERYLHETGTTIVKLYLHISKDEQRERLQDRLDRPEKHWKFDPGDLKERRLWQDYMKAYETAMERCSTPWAPWYVIPADRKWIRNVVVARILRYTLERLELAYPPAAEGLDDLSIEE